ncbi:MAG: hypothetical protein ACK56L_19090 [Pseudanabaena sp.]
MYEDIKPKTRIAALCAAILFLGFAFVLTQSTAAITQKKRGLGQQLLFIKIGFLKACRWQAFKKPILVFPAPSALETPKSVSY